MTTTENCVVKRITEGDNTNIVTIPKAFCSVASNSNNSDTNLVLNTWVQLVTTAPSIICGSSHFSVVDGGSGKYTVKYMDIDSNTYERCCLIGVHLTCDYLSLSLVPKSIEFRITKKNSGSSSAVVSFASPRTLIDIVSFGGSTIVKLQQNDEIYIEAKNLTNSVDITVIHQLISIAEI